MNEALKKDESLLFLSLLEEESYDQKNILPLAKNSMRYPLSRLSVDGGFFLLAVWGVVSCLSCLNRAFFEMLMSFILTKRSSFTLLCSCK